MESSTPAKLLVESEQAKQVIEFWYNYKNVKFEEDEILRKWKTLFYFIINPNDKKTCEVEASTSNEDHQESQSSEKDNETLKEFIQTSGSKIMEFFMWRKTKFSIFAREREKHLPPQKKETRRERARIYQRNRYHFKKHGIVPPDKGTKKVGRPVGSKTTITFSELVPALLPISQVLASYPATVPRSRIPNLNPTTNETSPKRQRTPRNSTRTSNPRNYKKSAPQKNSQNYAYTSVPDSSAVNCDASRSNRYPDSGLQDDNSHSQEEWVPSLVNNNQLLQQQNNAFNQMYANNMAANHQNFQPGPSNNFYQYHQSMNFHQNLLNSQLQMVNNLQNPAVTATKHESQLSQQFSAKQCLSNLSNQQKQQNYQTNYQQIATCYNNNLNYAVPPNPTIQFLPNSQVAVIAENYSQAEPASPSWPSADDDDEWVPEVDEIQNTSSRKKASTNKINLKSIPPKVPLVSSSENPIRNLIKPARLSTIKLVDPPHLSKQPEPSAIPVLPNPVVLGLEEKLKVHRPKCSHCSALFSSQKSLESHTKKYHSDLEKFSCKICSDIFTTRPRLASHIWTIHYNSKDEHFCPFCPPPEDGVKKGFARRKNLMRHINLHHRDQRKKFVLGVTNVRHKKNDDFKCSDCPEIFDSFAMLRYHYEDNHTPLTKCYFCKLCGIIIPKRDHLSEHLLRFHSKSERSKVEPEEPQFFENASSCAICDSKFISKEFLTQHNDDAHRVNHNKTDPKSCHHCNSCDRVFESETSLQSHLKRSWSCPKNHLRCFECNKKLENEDTLKKHYEEKHPQLEPAKTRRGRGFFKAYKCEFCRRSYETIINLRQHTDLEHCDFIISTVENDSPESINEGSTTSTVTNISAPNPSTVITAKMLEKVVPKRTEVILTVNSWHDRNLMTCTICDYKCTTTEFHESHKGYFRVEKRFCEFCKRIFDKPKLKWKHMKQVHNMDKPPDLVIEKLTTTTSHNNGEKTRRIWKKKGPEPELDGFDAAACKVCIDKFTMEQFHKFHTSAIKDVQKFGCDLCTKSFFDKPSYYRHKRTEHGDGAKEKAERVDTEKVANDAKDAEQFRQLAPPVPIEGFGKEVINAFAGTIPGVRTCNICLVNYKTEEFLQKHIEKDHAINRKRLFCSICNKTLSCANTMKRHMRDFHGIGKKDYCCPYCPKTMSRAEHIRYHIVNMHKDKNAEAEMKKIHRIPAKPTKQYKCDLCVNTFATEKRLMIHVSNIHCVQYFDSFCDFCGKQIRPDHLPKHVRTVHPAEHALLEPLEKKPRPITRIVNGTKLSLQEILPMIAELQEAESLERRAKEKNHLPKGRKRRITQTKKPSSTKSIKKSKKATTENESSDESESESEPEYFDFDETTSEKENELESDEEISKIEKTVKKSNKIKSIMKPLVIKPLTKSKKAKALSKNTEATKTDTISESANSNSVWPIVLLQRCDEAERFVKSLLDVEKKNSKRSFSNNKAPRATRKFVMPAKINKSNKSNKKIPVKRKIEKIKEVPATKCRPVRPATKKVKYTFFDEEENEEVYNGSAIETPIIKQSVKAGKCSKITTTSSVPKKPVSKSKKPTKKSTPWKKKSPAVDQTLSKNLEYENMMAVDAEPFFYQTEMSQENDLDYDIVPKLEIKEEMDIEATEAFIETGFQ